MTLSAPGRVTLPRAPPHSLLLYGSQFAPFPAGAPAGKRCLLSTDLQTYMHSLSL